MTGRVLPAVGAIIVLLFFLAGPVPAHAARWRLVARDGVPAAFRVTVVLDRPGTWAFRATWSGRGIGSLRLEEPGGRVVGRIAGASPLELRVPVPPGAAGRRLRIHFSSLGARGALAGELAAVPPAPGPGDEDSGSAGEEAAPVGVTGPGACLLEGMTADDREPGARRLRELATALAGASPRSLAWARKWIGRAVAASLDVEVRGREGFDALWEGLRLDPAPDPAVGRAVRGVLAVLEDLARREEARSGRPRRAGTSPGRCRALAHALSCLAAVDRAP